MYSEMKKMAKVKKNEKWEKRKVCNAMFESIAVPGHSKYLKDIKQNGKGHQTKRTSNKKNGGWLW